MAANYSVFERSGAPVRVKKTRQNNKLEPGSDSIRTDKALERSMSFQSRKITAETVLHFPTGPSAAAVAPSTTESLLPVLLVLHQETSTPGRVRNALRALGPRLDIRRPRFGPSLPATLHRHAPAATLAPPV